MVVGKKGTSANEFREEVLLCHFVSVSWDTRAFVHFVRDLKIR